MDRARFLALWGRCLIDDRHASNAGEIFEQIQTRYSEPHRRYHTPEHIDHCLRQHDLAAHLMDDRDAVELAIWFHDVIYAVPTDNNERFSAEFFTKVAADSVRLGLGRKVHDMILTTEHPQIPSKNDDKFLVDVDLSSFGLPWEEMRRDSENVRQEFADTTDENFFAGHIRFMRMLLERPEFFATEFFRNHYESQARSNIVRLLDEFRVAGFD
jgi:predicted metal-dependent HD superfamily phosphohydrolase